MGEMVRDYTATGKYKSENIPGNQYMEEHEREFFDKNAIVLERQAAIMAENYRSDKDDSLYDFIADLEEHEGEYVVDGALLACTRCSKQARKIKIDGVEFAGELRDVEINSRIYTGDRPQTINGLVPAGVKDSIGGMRGEEMITKIQGEEAGEVNIVSFGNCAFIPQGEELNKILLAQNMMHKKDKIIEAIKEGKGTCYCFMRLNEEWENLAIAGEYMVGEISTKKQQVNKSLLSAPYMKFNGVEGINMLSILFCQFGGGIIAALESGQREIEGRRVFIPEIVKGIVNGKEIVFLPKKNWGLVGKGSYPSGIQKDKEGRYKVAVGPKIIDPNYSNEGRIWTDDFKDLPHVLKVVLEHEETGGEKVIECVVSDYKAHTYNTYPEQHPNVSDDKAVFDVESGLLQTGIAYPNSWNADNTSGFAGNNIDGSIIEFAGQELDFNCGEYVLVDLIVLDD